MFSFKSNLLSSLFALPIAIMAFALPENEQDMFGIIQGGDCDGPLGVMIFSIPSYLIYSLISISSLVAFVNAKRFMYLSVALFAFCVLALITPNTIRAFEQHNLNTTVYKEKCGDGW